MSSDKPAPDPMEAVSVKPFLPPTIYESQRPLYELMVSSLKALRANYWDRSKGVLLGLFSLLVGVLIGVVLVLIAAWLVHRLNGPEWIVYLVCLFPVLVSVGTLMFRQRGWLNNIELTQTMPGRQLQFHRFEIAMGRGFLIYIASIGMFFGIHLQVIYQTGDHCGLDIAPSWPDSVQIAGTTLLDGISLDLTHAVGLSVGDRPNHTPQSAALFALFRSAYSGHVVVLAFALWRRRSILHLARKYDRYLANPTPTGLHEYLRAVCYRSKNWAKHYHDEFVFFCLVEKCLAKDYKGCSALHHLFPDIDVPQEVYDLFRKGNGDPVFATPADESLREP